MYQNDLQKVKKITLYWLLSFIYAAFIGLQLGKIQAIADFNYRIHEMFYIPINIAIFVVPVLLIVYFCLFIKTYKKGCKSTHKSKLKIGIVIISLVFVFLILGYQFQEVTTTGPFVVNEKVQEDSKYYIILDSKKIRVSRNEYNLINDGEHYIIGFRWNKFTPNIGNLETILPFETEYHVSDGSK